MNAFADALERAGIETSDFEEVEVVEEAIERDGEISDLEFEINENSEFLTSSQLKAKEEELKEKQAMVKTVKDPWCYRSIMRMLKVKDVSPYGLDVIRERPFAATKQERMRQFMMMDL